MFWKAWLEVLDTGMLEVDGMIWKKKKDISYRYIAFGPPYHLPTALKNLVSTNYTIIIEGY